MSVWADVALGDACHVIAGQSPPGTAYNNAGDGLPFYQGKKDFGGYTIKPPSVWTRTVTKRALAGDVLMSVRAPVGPINFATQESCIGRGLAAIRVRDGLDPNFLFYQLLWKQPEIGGRDGAVFASINRDDIAALRLTKPPLSEQQRIVAILAEAFEGIATATANAAAAIEHANALLDSFIDRAFNSAEWVCRRLGDVATLQRGYDLPVQERSPGPHPLVSSSGVIAHVAEAMVKGPGVVTGRSGSIGSVFLVKQDFWPLNTTLYVKDMHGHSPAFVLRLRRHFDLATFASGTGVPTLNRNHVHDKLVCVPPDEKSEDQFVDSVAAVEAEVNRALIIHRQKLTAFAALKQSLLHHAFTGQL